jgi:hypothetical protein
MMQGCKDGWSRRGWIGAVLAGFVALGAWQLGRVAPAGGAEAAATQPATAAAAARPQRPATAPATAEATTQPAGKPALVAQGLRPVPKGLSVGEASTLTAEETSLLGLVPDGDEQWVTTGLYILLRRAEMLPDGKATYDAASPIDTMSFWSSPAVLRGKLVRFDAFYAGRVDTVKSGANDWWGGKQFYMILVKAKPEQDAIAVAVTEKPPADLRMLTKLNFAGFYYKTFQWNVSGDTGNPLEKRVYPMLVAKKAYRFAGEVSSPLGGSTGALVAIAGGLLIFGMVRAYIRTRQRQAEEARAEIRAAAKPPEIDFDIDPELGRQVQEFQQFQAERPEEGQASDEKKSEP